MLRRFPFGFRDVVIVLVLHIIIGRILSQFITSMFWLFIINNSILVLLVLYYLRKEYSISAGDLGLDLRHWPADIVIGAAGAGALFVLVNVAVAQLIAEPKVHPIIQMVINAKGPADLVVPLAMAGVMAPVAEEIFYRGMVFNAIRKHYGLLLGALLAGAFFAIFHLRSTWLEVGIVGVGLCFIYHWSGDLVAPMLTHSILNTLQILLAYWRTH